MGLLSLCPWNACPEAGHRLVTGMSEVLRSRAGVVGVMDHLMPMSALTVILVEATRHYGTPVLVAVPAALVVLCFVTAKWLTRKDSSSWRPFERDPSEPRVCDCERAMGPRPREER
jgi:hypothetical protein